MASNNIKIENNLIKIFKNLLDDESNEKIKNSSMKNQVEWDSLKHMEIIFKIEKTFKIKLKQSHIIKMTSFKSILEILKKY